MLRVSSPEYVYMEARGQNQIHSSISFPSCLRSLKILDIPCNLSDHQAPDVHLPLFLQSCATEAVHHTHFIMWLLETWTGVLVLTCKYFTWWLMNSAECSSFSKVETMCSLRNLNTPSSSLVGIFIYLRDNEPHLPKGQLSVLGSNRDK